MNLASIVYIEINIQIPHARSLKDKRRHIKSLKEQLQGRFNVSVAELGDLDTWQHAVLGVVMIANDKQYLQQQVSNLENHVMTFRDVMISAIHQEWL